jgi:hypothetical protein
MLRLVALTNLPISSVVMSGNNIKSEADNQTKLSQVYKQMRVGR